MNRLLFVLPAAALLAAVPVPADAYSTIKITHSVYSHGQASAYVSTQPAIDATMIPIGGSVTVANGSGQGRAWAGASYRWRTASGSYGGCYAGQGVINPPDNVTQIVVKTYAKPGCVN